MNEEEGEEWEGKNQIKDIKRDKCQEEMVKDENKLKKEM
jgi:hypothetical protein